MVEASVGWLDIGCRGRDTPMPRFLEARFTWKCKMSTVGGHGWEPQVPGIQESWSPSHGWSVRNKAFSSIFHLFHLITFKQTCSFVPVDEVPLYQSCSVFRLTVVKVWCSWNLRAW